MRDRCINRGLRALLQAANGRVLVLPGRALARRVGIRVALAGTHVDGCDRRRRDGEREPAGQAKSRDLTTHMTLPSYEGLWMERSLTQGTPYALYWPTNADPSVPEWASSGQGSPAPRTAPWHR